MKKILLTLAIALTATFAYSQRSIDWSVEEIIKPTMVEHNKPITTHIVCKNNGADTAMVGDTLYSRVVLNGQLVSVWVFKLLTADLAPGDTIHHVFTINGAPVGGLSFNGSFSAQSLLQNRPDLVLETSATTTNNVKSSTIPYINDKGWGVSVNTVAANDFMSIYPNPSSNNFNVDVKMLGGDVQLQMIDMTGKTVKTINNMNTATGFNVNVSDLSKGLYIVQLKSGDFISSSKVNVQ
ncbi:MAG: T9SS type A sorting domain-containing protein [Bacteroidia bacterium]